MRTMIGADDVVESLPRLSVMDGNGSWVDITSRLYSVSLNDSLGADSASVTLGLRNQPDKWVTGSSNENLDPLDVNSSYFINSEPLLGYYHEVKLEVSKDSGSNYYEIFRGYAGPGSVEVSTSVKRDDTITFTPCDLSFPYKQYHFYDSLVYKSADATSIMSQIFADHGFNQTVTVIDNPNRHIDEVTTGQTNVWAAQKSLIEPTGYIYRIKYYGSAFKPCVYDPDRDKTTPDKIFRGTFQHRKIDISEADVRTKVVVIYRNRASGTIEYAQDEDEAARSKYGIPDGSGNRLHKTMWYSAQGTGNNFSLIDTPGEASTLAGYILHDLKAPVPDVEVRIPRVNPALDIHDLLSFVGNDYTVNVGVTSLTWNWSTDNKIGETIIQGTADRVIGEFTLWTSRDASSLEVQHEQELALLQGDGKPPDSLSTPVARSFWGTDSSTGADCPVVVLTVTPSHVWDHSFYLWTYYLNDEVEPTQVRTTEPRLTIKGLPVGSTVRAFVQDVDWSAKI